MIGRGYLRYALRETCKPHVSARCWPLCGNTAPRGRPLFCCPAKIRGRHSVKTYIQGERRHRKTRVWDGQFPQNHDIQNHLDRHGNTCAGSLHMAWQWRKPLNNGSGIHIKRCVFKTQRFVLIFFYSTMLRPSHAISYPRSRAYSASSS